MGKKRHVILLLLVLCIAITGCGKSNSGETGTNNNEATNESKEPDEGQNSENRFKPEKIDGELRAELLPLAEHVDGKYNIIVNIKTPDYLSIEGYDYIDPNRDISDKSSYRMKSGGEYSDIAAFDTIYTPQDAIQNFTSLNVVPNYYYTLIGKNVLAGLHLMTISLEYDDENYEASGGQRVIRTYEDFQEEAVEKEWEATLDEGDTYTYNYGKGTAGNYEYYYSIGIKTMKDIGNSYEMFINFKISDQYILAFVEQCGSTNEGQGPLGLFIDGTTVDTQGYADYLATWIMPAK